MDRTALLSEIQGSSIPASEKDMLMRRLKVASHEGVAAVVRDFGAAKQKALAQERARNGVSSMNKAATFWNKR